MKKRHIIFIVISCIVLLFIVLSYLYDNYYNKMDSQTKLDNVIEKLMKDDTISSSIVLVKNSDREIVWQSAKGLVSKEDMNQITTDTPYFIASITKMFTATLIMMLHEKGLLDIEESISNYLSENTYSNLNVHNGVDYSKMITVRHLLEHSSGIADYYTGKPLKDKALFDEFLLHPSKKWSVDDTIERVKNDLIPNDKPGNSLLYSDTNYQLLGKIIENVSDKKLYEVYQELIFSPLNLKNTYLINYPSETESHTVADIYHYNQNVSEIRYNGSYWADGGLVSTADDCIDFLIALNNGKLLSPETLQLMHNWQKLFFPIQYGLGTMYFKLPAYINYFADMPEIWGHSGTTGAFLFYCEKSELYIAGTINQNSSNIRPFMLIGEILRILR